MSDSEKRYIFNIIKFNLLSRQLYFPGSPLERSPEFYTVLRRHVTMYDVMNYHIYHPKCIKEWCNHKAECPLCKVEIAVSRSRSDSRSRRTTRISHMYITR